MPSLYIITGSNGAGKSTVGPQYLPPHIRQNCSLFDGDLLYVKKLSELFPKEIPSPKEARKLALQYVLDTFGNLTDEALKRNLDFVYEGHFGSYATWETPKRFKDVGYVIHLIFLGLTSPDLSQLRVTDRVNEGGHFVDRLTIENNFYGNLEMLNLNFRFIDYLTIVDTSKIQHAKLANLKSGMIISSVNPDLLPDWFKSYLPDIAKLIIK